MSLIGVLIQFIVLLVVVGILYMIGRLVIQALTLPAMAMTILQVICLLIFLVWVLSVFGLLGATGISGGRGIWWGTR